ncbi:MAG: VanZ family protein [candidate division WOR-3 bacterium]|nr:VanZ family protein [candidate division WOR-3 bacterium]
MGVKILLRAMFIFWALAVAALSIISHPGSKDLLMAVKVTSSGFVVHGIAYFVGMWLCFLAFEKKISGDRMTEQGDLSQGMIAFGKDDSLREGWMDGKCGMITAGMDGKNKGRRSGVTFIWMSGLLIFLFSVVLEVVQFYLPYRTFNWCDVVGNCLGVAFFVVIMLKQTLKRGKIKKLEC